MEVQLQGRLVVCHGCLQALWGPSVFGQCFEYEASHLEVREVQQLRHVALEYLLLPPLQVRQGDDRPVEAVGLALADHQLERPFAAALGDVVRLRLDHHLGPRAEVLAGDHEAPCVASVPRDVRVLLEPAIHPYHLLRFARKLHFHHVTAPRVISLGCNQHAHRHKIDFVITQKELIGLIFVGLQVPERYWRSAMLLARAQCDHHGPLGTSDSFCFDCKLGAMGVQGDPCLDEGDHMIQSLGDRT
mmetsp:Transcript_115670/g.373731  ORF Transcript_115670/g.373731 Transcript_115670/m.373731 type:complete len:245 (-) Transcript_115670:2892-3626(-)